MLKETLSPSEINRYLFCNYQWYYERKYGAAELRRRKKEHLEELGVTPNEDGPIQRGLVFHARFGRRRRLKLIYIWLRAVILVVLFLYFLWTSGIAVI